MVNLRYVSSSGISFDLHDFDSAKLQKANFHNVSWNPEVIKKQYGTVINRFTKNAQEFDCTFKFKGAPSQRKTQIDAFIFETEMDIATMKPGRIYWNNQYIDVYFDSHKCQPVNAGETWTELSGEFYAAFPFWIEEFAFSIDPGSVEPMPMPEDVKGFPVERNLVYAYTYSYPYVGNSGEVFIDTPIGADFSVTVYGPVSDYVEIVIADNIYKINHAIANGQKLIVDSRDTLPLSEKCYILNSNGSKVNVFDYRDPQSQIFKRLPGGKVHIYAPQLYKCDFIIYLERSAPI